MRSRRCCTTRGSARRSIPPTRATIEEQDHRRDRERLSSEREAKIEEIPPAARRRHEAHESYTPRMRRTTRCSLWFGLCPVGLLAESAGGLQWAAPDGWKNEGALPMRAATYAVAPAAGDKAGAECAVFYFGIGPGRQHRRQSRTLEGTVSGAGSETGDGSDCQADPPWLKRHVPLTPAGEYSGMSGPMAGWSQGVPGYRLLGAIVEGPRGNVFVKFTGPAKTIAANQQKFEQLLGSFQPAP